MCPNQNFLLIAAALFGSSIITNYASAKNSNSQSLELSELIPVDLNDLEQSYLTFVVSMAPAFNDTSYNIYNSRSEFNEMNGIESFLSLPSLLSQFITPYAICKEQSDQLIKELQTILHSTKLNGVNILLTTNQLNTLEEALAMFAYYDTMAVNGLLEQIDCATSMVYDPSFKHTSMTIEMSSAMAINFTNSLSKFLAGNQGLVKAFTYIQNLNVSTVVDHQNNAAADYFIKSIFNFYNENLKAYTSITNEIENLITSFYSQSPIQRYSTTYAVPISTIVTSVSNSSEKLANLFAEIFNIFTVFEQSITNPRGFSK